MRKYSFLFVIVFAMFIMIPFEVSAMQIFVKKPNAENIILEVESSDTIEAVKEKIYAIDNTFLPENQKLVFAGNELEDGRTLSDYEIKKDDTIRLILSINNEKVKVIFDANGGFFENETTYVIDDWHAKLYDSLINPVKEGYKFKGYYTEKNGGTKFEMILNEAGIDSDMRFYAQWEEDESIPQEIEDLQASEEIENPDTGDNIILFALLGIVSLLGIIGLSIYLMKKNGKGAK